MFAEAKRRTAVANQNDGGTPMAARQHQPWSAVVHQDQEVHHLFSSSANVTPQSFKLSHGRFQVVAKFHWAKLELLDAAVALKHLLSRTALAERCWLCTGKRFSLASSIGVAWQSARRVRTFIPSQEERWFPSAMTTGDPAPRLHLASFRFQISFLLSLLFWGNGAPSGRLSPPPVKDADERD